MSRGIGRNRSKHGRGVHFQYARPEPRVIGPCVDPGGCPGTLTSASLAGICVISCTVCDALWHQDRWLDLVTELGRARVALETERASA